jgi:hypothetical protein
MMRRPDAAEPAHAVAVGGPGGLLAVVAFHPGESTQEEGIRMTLRDWILVLIGLAVIYLLIITF